VTGVQTCALPISTNVATETPQFTRDAAFALSGNLHHGFFSVVDRFGIVGCLFFVLWTVAALRRMATFLLEKRPSTQNCGEQWLAIYVIAFTIAFPLGALRAENFLPYQLFFIGLFVALTKGESDSISGAHTTKLVLSSDPSAARELSAAPGKS